MPSAMMNEAPASKRQCKRIERSAPPTPPDGDGSSLVSGGSDYSLLSTPSESSPSPVPIQVKDLAVPAAAPRTPPKFEFMPSEIIQRIADSFPTREITISCNRDLYSKGYEGLYAKRHHAPVILNLNRHIRNSAKDVYRPSFEGFLEHGAIYVNFAVDTLVIANHETFNKFFVRLSYSPDLQNPEERRDCEDRCHVDNKLEHLAFRTYLDAKSMMTLVHFRQLQSVTFVQRPAPVRPVTRHDKRPTKDKIFMDKTIALWEETAKTRKQGDFRLPEMTAVPLEGFDSWLEITERPKIPEEETEEVLTRYPWANTSRQKWMTELL